ncbi:MAG: prephenate dehydrogenase/arogenate dehydrogenase family protein [Chloroflexota bacterium]|nr:prephenate dehydrogenase/arogenate dehydrogenase family protein [Chloroflexota bacterium]
MRVAIIGLGLIGGSMGLALRDAGIEVVGYARRPETASLALECKAVDRVEADAASAVVASDVVVVATPVLAVRDVFAEISGSLSEGAIVTDVSSTKVEVMRWAEELLPSRVSFIGGHPMAGRETPGIEAADAELFRGCTYCLVPGGGSADEAYETLEGLVWHIGANPLRIDAGEHDRLVAGISHLPLLISVALVASATGSPLWPSMAWLAASGYRDTTRLASGNPRMGRDICLTNKGPIIDAIDAYIEELKRIRRMIIDGDEKLEEYLIRVRQSRQDWLRQR